MATPLTPKDTEEIRVKFVDFLNDHLIDPYEQAKNVGRDGFVKGKDFQINSLLAYPLVHISVEDVKTSKINSQTKTNYLEEEEHNFVIYYYNNKVHNYTFEDGITLQGEAQNRKFLQYIKNTIKHNGDKFGEFCHNITFGTISTPELDQSTNTYIGMIPMTVYTYRR